MNSSIYHFIHYRAYLREVLAERGRKKRLAQFIPCQTTFLSNVLAETANLSLEHAMRTCEFLGLNEKESHYFVLLVQHAKAGSQELENYFLKQVGAIQKEQEKITYRISTHETIPIEDQAKLYNSWLYVAVHILCAVHELQTRKSLREYLRLEASEIDPVIDFLIQHRVLVESHGRLKQGSTRIHLPKESPFLMKHHMNWRVKAIQSLDSEKPEDLHYSLVISLSKKDVVKMKEIVLEAVQKTDRLLKETGDEVVYSLCMDWFKV